MVGSVVHAKLPILNAQDPQIVGVNDFLTRTARAAFLDTHHVDAPMMEICVLKQGSLLHLGHLVRTQVIRMLYFASFLIGERQRQFRLVFQIPTFLTRAPMQWAMAHSASLQYRLRVRDAHRFGLKPSRGESVVHALARAYTPASVTVPSPALCPIHHTKDTTYSSGLTVPTSIRGSVPHPMRPSMLCELPSPLKTRDVVSSPNSISLQSTLLRLTTAHNDRTISIPHGLLQSPVSVPIVSGVQWPLFSAAYKCMLELVRAP